MASEVRKAAVLLDSLSCNEALALLARLDGREVAAVAGALVRAGTISAEEQRTVHQDFVARLAQEKPAPAGPFDFLQTLDQGELVSLFRDEHPQTIALVAAHLPRAIALALLAAMPDHLQRVVARAIATLREVEPPVLDEVAAVLHEQLVENNLEPKAKDRDAGAVLSLTLAAAPSHLNASQRESAA